MVKLFQANEKFSEQYLRVKMEYTTLATFFVAITSTIVTTFKTWVFWSSLVECLTQDRGAAG